MKIRKMRLARAWSQEQLAELSGLSVRTIQRLERGQSASLESLKCLAAVFDVDINELHEEISDMQTTPNSNPQEQQELAVVEYVRDLKGFYSHLTNYLVVMVLLLIINLVTGPEYLWVVWPALGWGVGIANHAAHTFEWFNWFNEKWEKRQIEKRLGRKL